MVKPTRLRYACQKRHHRTGKLEWWFRKGKMWRLLPGDPGADPKASKAYWDHLMGVARGPKDRTINALIVSYKSSPAFAAISEATRKDYGRTLTYIAESSGNVVADRLKRSDVIEARDANAHRPRFANKLISMLSVIMEHGIDMDWRLDNPARGVKHFKGGEGHQPWPSWAIANFRAHATGPARTAFELCLGTGQRIRDVLEMRWDEIEGDEIFVKQSKTGVELWIPFTDDLRAYLETLPRGLRTTIVCNRLGEPYAYRNWFKRFDRCRKSAGAEDFKPHGLRYNAASELYEAGCTDAQVQAITGHKTRQHAAKYGKGASQRRLAREARKRGGVKADFENRTKTESVVQSVVPAGRDAPSD